MSERKEKCPEDRDVIASHQYVERKNGMYPKPGTCYGKTRMRKRKDMREAFLQGWHEAMVARDEDEANAVWCTECGVQPQETEGGMCRECGIK